MIHQIDTWTGGIEVREVHPAMLPDGKWFHLVPASLAGRPMVLTSDLARLKREVEAENAKHRGEAGDECLDDIIQGGPR